MEEIVESKIEPAPRVLRILKAMKAIGIITAVLIALSYPIPLAILAIIYPNADDLWANENASNIARALGPHQLSLYLCALAILITGVIDRIKYYYSHKNDENTSRTKLILATIVVSALWFVPSYGSIIALAFIYNRLTETLF